MNHIPNLSDLLQVVQTLAPEEIPALMAQCAALQTALAARLVTIPASNGQTHITDGDQLLSVEQAAQKLGVSHDWLSRRATKLPFAVRLGRRQLRFSAHGIDRYIRQRQGR